MIDKIWEKGLQASAVLMNFLVVFCVETAIFAAFPTLATAMEESTLVQPSLFRQLCLILVPVLFWLIREYAKYFSLFVAGHGIVAVAAVALLGETVMQRLVFGVITAVYLVNSFRIRLTGQTMEDGHEIVKGKGMDEKRLGVLISGVVAGATYIFCVYLGNEAGSGRIWNTALLFSFLYFLDTYLQNLDRFVQFNRSSNSHIPVRGMLIRGGSLTLGFSLVAVAVLTLGSDNSLMRRLTDSLQQTGLWLIRTIARAIAWLLNLFEGGSEEAVEEAAGMEMAEAFGVAEASEASPLMDILSKIFITALLLAAAAFICVAIYRLVVDLVHRFYQRQTPEQEDGGQMIEIRESLKKEKEKKTQEKGLSYFARTPEERIRRSFVKTVKKTEKYRNPDGQAGAKRGKDLWRRDAQARLIRGKTARQIGEAVGLTGDVQPQTGWLGIELSGSISAADRAEGDQLITLYEQARYGQGSTAEDAKRAEQAAGRLSAKLGRR